MDRVAAVVLYVVTVEEIVPVLLSCSAAAALGIWFFDRWLDHQRPSSAIAVSMLLGALVAGLVSTGPAGGFGRLETAPLFVIMLIALGAATSGVIAWAVMFVRRMLRSRLVRAPHRADSIDTGLVE